MITTATHPAPTTTLSAEEIEYLAHKRAAARLGWIRHATVFLAVTGVLIARGFLQGQAPLPIWGWAIGLAVHGFVVFVAPGNLKARMVERERQRLALLRDPW